MPLIYSLNTLPEAVEWLTSKTSEEWSEKKMIDCAVNGEIVLLALVPGWKAPGDGELEMTGRDRAPVVYVSDGLIEVGNWTLRNLLSRERANLNTDDVKSSGIQSVQVFGTDQIVDSSHLRVRRSDLEQFAMRSSSTIPVNDSKAAAQTPADNREILDITSMRGTPRMVIEHWSAITVLYGHTPDGHQVKRFLDKNEPEKSVRLKTVQNTLINLRKKNLIP